MKMVALFIVSALWTFFLASGQVPKPGYGDKGCPEKDLFADTANVGADDYIEIHQIHCFTNCPLYTVRVYGNGGVAWHGDKAVAQIGDATTRVSAEQAQSFIASARQSGFGALCGEYAMRGFDGLISSTSLRIGDRLKFVANEAPSNAPGWLYKLDTRVADFVAVAT